MLIELLAQYDVLIFLASIALIAGMVDAIAGGGGMLTLPALLLAGLPPIQAIATNKLQSCFGVASASMVMLYHRLISAKTAFLLWICSAIGSAIGALLILQLGNHHLHIIVMILLAVMGTYMLLMPQLGQVKTKAKIKSSLYHVFIVPLLGFYDGFFGPGMGSLSAISNVILQGNDIKSATACAKFINFASNFAALIVFLWAGEMVFLYGIVMIFGQIIGAFIGAKLVIARGLKLIRPLIVITSFTMLIVIIIKTF
jgi:uncharacterized membrane protein YfcA